ncbi:MAG: hypothetical protein PHQ23_10590, partial [Candidatus Wallbacteria bacterium]|nr:hypothetical protein [Candidatus Wallbacteria bacterium]
MKSPDKSSVLHFLGHRIRHLVYSIHPKNPEGKQIELAINAGSKHKLCDKDKNIYELLMEVSVIGGDVLECKLTLEGGFKLPEDAKPEDIERMMTVNA